MPVKETGHGNARRRAAAENANPKSKQANASQPSTEAPSEKKVEDIVAETSSSSFRWLYILEAIIGPIFFTLLGAYIRLNKIGAADRVIWDEAHFGKFGSFYLKHQYYFDVHPPLGKMLCGLSGHIAGYNGSFGFESGSKYPDYLQYHIMRQFNAAFSILCVPVAYFTAKALKFSLPAVWLAALLVAVELSFATLARFILLDSMLLLFTVLTFYCLVKFHQTQKNPFSFCWMFWLTATGVSIGLTTSVKMVGLFVMALVGVYTITDLWIRWSDRKISLKKYVWHWMVRGGALMIVPLIVFMIAFKLHFTILTKTGEGLGSMSSLFQANLEGNEIQSGPMNLAFGSKITLKNSGLSGGLLHSHHQTYPDGSKQQQVTTYAHVDTNNDWLVQYPRNKPSYTDDQPLQFLQDGDVVRLVHFSTKKNLHSHEVRAPASKHEWEVSGYGNDTIGDDKDHWVVEVAENLGEEDPDHIHPLTTSLRFRHQVLGCYLGTTSVQLPDWGFKQGEVACIRGRSKLNKMLWWDIDSHTNHRLPDAVNRTLPKSKFVRDFIQLNFAQMASNNALVPDEDKDDHLASSWWEWPLMRRGLRLCSWGNGEMRYYLMMLPSTVWLTTAGVGIFVILVAVSILRWQRGFEDWSPEGLEQLCLAGFLPFLGWAFHYAPFALMSRVTYFHHYMPALYFAMVLFVYLLELATCRLRIQARVAIYGFFIALTAAFFALFYPCAMGMNGDSEDFNYLQWLPLWNMGNGNH